MAACSPSQRLRQNRTVSTSRPTSRAIWLLFRPAAADRMILPRRANCWGVLYRRTRVSNPCCSSGDNSTTGGFGPRIAFTTTLHLSNLNALIILLGLFSPPVLEQLDYYGKLSSQLQWRREPGNRQVRVVYSGWGAPTAAVLHEDDVIVDYKLFWIVCRDAREAYYLLAIINSDTLADAVNKYTTPNWSGKTRDLQKHLWKLPIPEFDPEDSLHAVVSEAGRVAAEGAAERLARLRQDRGEVTVTIARREVRKWLRESTDGKAVEEAVEELLAKTGVTA